MKKSILYVCAFLSVSAYAASFLEETKEIIEAPLEVTNDLLDDTENAVEATGEQGYAAVLAEDNQAPAAAIVAQEGEINRPLVTIPADTDAEDVSDLFDYQDGNLPDDSEEIESFYDSLDEASDEIL